MTLLILLNLFALNTFAQDYTQWSLPDGATARLGKGLISGNIAYSPDGTRLAVGSHIGIWLYDTTTYQEVALLTGHTRRVLSVAFSPDGKTIVSGSDDRTVRLWEVDTGTHTRTLTGHTRRVLSVAFSPDGKTIASGSYDGTVLLWELTPPTLPVTGDVNGDGGVNILDLVLVASAFGNAAAAPAVHFLALGSYGTGDRSPTAADVKAWLTQARQMGLTTPDYLRGIAVLEQLLAALTPPETVLLPNYPNPFNPETWIPYHLAHAADVMLTIYDTKGVLVRRLDLGHQPAGYYTARSKAAYWDGRNERGESVASGVYFYQLRAGDYTALRRMVIVK